MSDQELINLILRSKEEGYCALVNKYKVYVNAIVSGVLRNCGTEEDAEECISDIFVKLVMDTSYLDENRETLKSYIGVVARNCAIDLFRKLTGRSRYLSDEEISDKVMNLVSKRTPESVISGREMRSLIWENVKLLGPPDSEIITAQYLYGRSVKEIAASLSMNYLTVHKRSMRARKKLQKMLESAFIKENIRKEDFYETSVY